MDNMVIDISEASVIDATEILEIQKLAFQGQAFLYNDFKLPPLVQTLDDLLLDFGNYTFLKAVYEEKIVGSVRGCVKGDTCFISRLMVCPDFQSRGIGKKLMIAVESRFKAVKRYELHTGHKSKKNLALYRKLGYQKFHEKPQGEKVMLICMEKWNG